ncbi:MAG: hypothetical protein BWY75_00632 [bacterium ADurb.Bin425]|nr:MAG: hypothetical protein BWY75_00632 [bacterium ADurb.Bin425]
MENGALKFLFLLLAFALACLSFKSLRRPNKSKMVKAEPEADQQTAPQTAPAILAAAQATEPSAVEPKAEKPEAEKPGLPDALLPDNYFQALEDMPVERKALYFGINHFESLKETEYGALTEESLRAAYMKWPVAAERLCLIYLLKQLPQLGTVLGTKESVSYVSGNGWAMPIRFQKSIYGLNRQALMDLLNLQSKPVKA